MKIAIVENEKNESETLKSYLEAYAKKRGIRLFIERFFNGIDFLSNYGGYDVVFMDIMMPLMDGMATAEKLRRIDNDCAIIFVTNMAQYAIKGYRVNALDFLVKPVSYAEIEVEMDKIAGLLRRKSAEFIWIKQDGAKRRIDYASIYYLEILNHEICIHAKEGQFRTRGTLREYEENLGKRQFSRPNNCYIVNMYYIVAVDKDTVLMETGEEISISRPRKKLFMNDFTLYLNGGGV